ncbi:MAG: phosphotransferase [Chromatiales bacterium]|nr:phosphotransferase [Gammaproteobacteria bacterium]MCP5351962.1 phosphotransferase [Chromatiales bacterium]
MLTARRPGGLLTGRWAIVAPIRNDHWECGVDERLAGINRWLTEELGFGEFHIAPASADASFRRYFRVTREGQSLIVMDAPPDKENTGPFRTVAKAMFDIGLNVPEIIEADVGNGYLLLGDLGTQTYLPNLNTQSVDGLYGDALNALITLQGKIAADAPFLPPYDHKLLMFEMSLFKDWFLGRHLGVELDAAQTDAWNAVCATLAASALEQPKVAVHRDYHSRNLMITAVNNPGIIDFQDAVAGPITYDLVSLLRDCYIAWPRARVETWAQGYRRRAVDAGLLHAETVDAATWLRWFDLMGVQRHLKAIGIFARLNHRDGKPGYLGDIPRTLGYVIDVCSRYPQLAGLAAIVETLVVQRVVPEFAGERGG